MITIPIKSNSWFVGICVLSVNFLSFTANIGTPWTSPFLPKLNGHVDPDQNPLQRPITLLEESWISSLYNLGALCGLFFIGITSEKLGQKMALICFSIPILISNILLITAHTIIEFYIARFLLGVGSASVFTILPLYVAEIIDVHNRGKAGMVMPLTAALSHIAVVSVGPYVTISTFACLSLIPTFLFYIIFVPFVPESPYRYMQIQKNERAEKCLKKFRGNSDVKNEMENVYNLLSHERVENQNIFKDIVTSSSTKRALIICCTLILCQIFMGYSFLAVYLQTVIEATDDTIPYYAVTMTVGVLQTFSGILCGSLVDKLGRKILMYISAVGCSVSMFSLSIYFFLKIREYNIDSMFWLPLVTLSMFFVFFCLGMGIIPIILTGELYSPNVKSVCLSITFMFSMGSAFLYTAAIPFVLNIFGIDVMFCVCGIVSILAVIFLKIFVPETKGRSFEEIQILLGSKK